MAVVVFRSEVAALDGAAATHPSRLAAAPPPGPYVPVSMVNVGVIGLGSVWEARYRPALGRLGQRLWVRALYDPVLGKAELAAAEHRTVVEGGLLALAQRPDVDALLLLDTGWYGCEALRLLCSAAKPIYIAADLGDEPSMLLAMHWTAVSFGLTLMPELGYRYTPASNRLQELIATRLGRPKRIRLRLDGATLDGCVAAVPSRAASIGIGSGPVAPTPESLQADRRSLVNWFDWLRYVFRTSAESVSVGTPAGEVGTRALIHIEYAPPKNSDTGPVAEIHIVDNAQASGTIFGRPEVECERGVAAIHTPTIIRWKAEGDADFTMESLLSDRSETEVMLDHFCRRVVGGLIPVADLADISRSLELIHAARESARTGSRVVVNGQATQ
jgi:predicted dehydrogenase